MNLIDLCHQLYDEDPEYRRVVDHFRNMAKDPWRVFTIQGDQGEMPADLMIDLRQGDAMRQASVIVVAMARYSQMMEDGRRPPQLWRQN